MRLRLASLLAILSVLALVIGGAVGPAMPALAQTPCAHHSHDPSAPKHHHDHQSSGCLTCCLGACAAIPDLPSPVLVSEPGFARRIAMWWPPDAALDGRSVLPDPDPPRTSALT